MPPKNEQLETIYPIVCRYCDHLHDTHKNIRFFLRQKVVK